MQPKLVQRACERGTGALEGLHFSNAIPVVATPLSVQVFTEEAMLFQQRIFRSSGISGGPFLEPCSVN